MASSAQMQADEVDESRAMHADELADFDAKLYPKPWSSGGAEGYLYTAICRHTTTHGHPPRRVRTSDRLWREVMIEHLGARRTMPFTDDFAMCTFAGVPVVVDPALSGFTMYLEDRTDAR